MATTVAIPFWVIGMLLFVFGVLVGKVLFQYPSAKYSRPPTPPDPYQRPHQATGWQPVRAAYPENINPPPKAP